MTCSRRLAAAQTIPTAGDVSANVAQHVALARLAAREGAELVVFPELSLTGYELALAAQSSAPIRVFIHSPGGHLESGDTIHDLIQFIEPEVHMVGSGWVASAGALIFAAAARTHRVCLPHAFSPA